MMSLIHIVRSYRVKLYDDKSFCIRHVETHNSYTNKDNEIVLHVSYFTVSYAYNEIVDIDVTTEDDKRTNVAHGTSRGRSNSSRGEIETTLQNGTAYSLCITSKTSGIKYVEFDFGGKKDPHTAGSKREVDEGADAVEQLCEDLEYVSGVVKDTLSKSSIFDTVYDRMEFIIYASIVAKSLIVFVVCCLQLYLFMKMVNTNQKIYSYISDQNTSLPF